MAENASPRSILIYGAGAVGSLIAAALAAGGASVTLLGRPELQRAVEQHGLRLTRPNGDLRLRVPVVTAIDQLDAPPDLVILTTKAYAVEAALTDLERLAAAGAAVIAMQNGVGTEARLAKSDAIARLGSGALTLSVSAAGPGDARQETTRGGIALAPVRGPAPLDALRQALVAGGIPTVIAPDYRSVKWSKLLLNLLANAGSAIVALPPAAIFADPMLFRIERRAFLEALRVMRAGGIAPIALPGFDVPLLGRAMRLPAPLARRLVGPRASRGRGDKRPSLWLDLEQGKARTEVAWLNGAVARRGAELGISTPVNTKLAALVEEIAANPAGWSAFKGRPDRLAQTVLGEAVES